MFLLGTTPLICSNEEIQETQIESGFFSSFITFFTTYVFGTPPQEATSTTTAQKTSSLSTNKFLNNTSKPEKHSNSNDQEVPAVLPVSPKTPLASQPDSPDKTYFQPVGEATPLLSYSHEKLNFTDKKTQEIISVATGLILTSPPNLLDEDSEKKTGKEKKRLSKRAQKNQLTDTQLSMVENTKDGVITPSVTQETSILNDEPVQHITQPLDYDPITSPLIPSTDSSDALSENVEKKDTREKELSSKFHKQTTLKDSDSFTLDKLYEAPLASSQEELSSLIYDPLSASSNVHHVDFFNSMEWSLKKNHDIRRAYFLKGTKKTKDRLTRLNTLKKLYDKNSFLNKKTQGKPVIPKIIHQIWVGPKTPPAIFKESQESIKKHHPDWEYKLWTDADLTHLQLYNQKFYSLSVNYGEKADILRYEILFKYGGIYLDVDFVCLQPLDILLQYDFWTTIQPIDCYGEINNAALGSVPGHPLLEDCITTVKNDWYTYKNPKVLGSIIDKVGPRHLQRSFMKFVENQTSNIIALPASFFYPIDIRDRLIVLENQDNKNHRIIESMIKPETFAMHCWAGSWWNDKKNEKLLGEL